MTRVGYGTGEEVAEGRWTAARELPRATARAAAREAALRPQERFAALLAGRDVALACELLALRARLDLDHGRDREAALQLEAALAAALSELEAGASWPGCPSGSTSCARVGAGGAAARGGLDRGRRWRALGRSSGAGATRARPRSAGVAALGAVAALATARAWAGARTATAARVADAQRVGAGAQRPALTSTAAEHSLELRHHVAARA